MRNPDVRLFLHAAERAGQAMMQLLYFLFLPAGEQAGQGVLHLSFLFTSGAARWSISAIIFSSVHMSVSM